MPVFFHRWGKTVWRHHNSLNWISILDPLMFSKQSILWNISAWAHEAGSLAFFRGKGTMLEPPGVRMWVGSPRGESPPSLGRETWIPFQKNAGEKLGGLPVSERSLAWEEACSCMCVCVRVCAHARVHARLLTLLVPWAAATWKRWDSYIQIKGSQKQR